VWNRWRDEHPDIILDLSEPPPSEFDSAVTNLADAVCALAGGLAPGSGGPLMGVNLAGVNLRDARLCRADLVFAILPGAKLQGADLRGARLAGANLTVADLTGADLRGANLVGASLRGATLKAAKLEGAILMMVDLSGAHASEADLRGADLTRSLMVETDFSAANLSGSHIYGTSVWNVKLEGAIQTDLSITRAKEATIRVDDLQVGQFIYLILDNRAIRNVIDTLTTRTVLLLGRFSPSRKPVLNAVRDALRARGYVPVIFDFEPPASRDFTETVTTLAHISRFVVADLTDQASVPKELEAIIPELAIPLQPIIQRPQDPYTMFADYWKYDWVMDTHQYANQAELVTSLNETLIARAEEKADALESRRNRRMNWSRT
jgi:uncharacterized protein YjbI with pentapeptide repeats